MNIKEIRELAEILKNNDLSSIEISEGETTVKLKREVQVVTAPTQSVVAQNVTEVITEAPQQAVEKAAVVGGSEIKSPMVGVFYSAPSPDEDDFVTIGSKVKKGDVLCLVEAMKLMNEIVADKDGEIVDILVSNEQVVEYGQVMFKLK